MKLSSIHLISKVTDTAQPLVVFCPYELEEMFDLEDSVKMNMWYFFVFTLLESGNSIHGPCVEHLS